MRYKGLKEGCNVLKERYKAPWIQVREAFFVENLADTLVSARGTVTQSDWGVDKEVCGEEDSDGDLWVAIN
jgi:hypothetical protein